jgi:hypothetical protein
MAETMRIRYVGLKPQKTDNVAGTGLVWLSDQVHEVPRSAAFLLLKHPDVWEADGAQDDDVVDAAKPAGKRGRKSTTAETALVKTEVESEPTIQGSLPPINEMSDADLIVLVETQFHERMDESMPIAEKRARAYSLYNMAMV